jgi:hypothetical protein
VIIPEVIVVIRSSWPAARADRPAAADPAVLLSFGPPSDSALLFGASSTSGATRRSALAFVFLVALGIGYTSS